MRRDVPVPLIESLGTVTGKYPAKDKITSSAVDLLGEESIQRLLHITDTNNPYRFDLRRGALARVAGGGIHFSDEIYKNKKDLVQVYLGSSRTDHRDRRLQVADRHPDHRHQQQLRIQPLPRRKGGGADRRPLPDLLRLPQHQLSPAVRADRLRHRQRAKTTLTRDICTRTRTSTTPPRWPWC
jgi:hypothetical protein